MGKSDGVNWDEEVEKERAKIYAQRNPNPPLPRWKKVVLLIAGLLAVILSCQAWRIVIG